MTEVRLEAAAVCSKLLKLWKSVRYLNSRDQLHPRFLGWITCLFKIADSKATKIKYLPPIPIPITEYGTLVEIFHISRQLAVKANIYYTHITLDVGAAMKAFQVIWNNPPRCLA